MGVEDPQDQKCRLERYMKETRRLYGVLDKRLAGRGHVADACSIADFAILGWAWRHERHKIDLADFPNVRAQAADDWHGAPGDQTRVRGRAVLASRVCLTPGRGFPKHGRANAVSGIPRVRSLLPAEGWPSG